MWSGQVVVLDLLPHHPLQVAPADDQHPVQTFPAARTDLPLHVRVRLGRRDWRLDHTHALGFQDGIGWTAELGGVIVNHKANWCQRRFHLRSIASIAVGSSENQRYQLSPHLRFLDVSRLGGLPQLIAVSLR